MPTVVLLRHGRTTANTAGILAGQLPGVPLDERGRVQADDIGRRLASVPFSAVIASPLERTKTTARAVIKHSKRPVGLSTDRAFIECDYGTWSGKKLSALAGKPLWSVVQQHPSAAEFPGGESMRGMQARAVEGIRAWNEAVGERGVYLVVSHGDLIKAIIADALGMHLDHFQRIAIDPGSISVISYTALRPFVVKVNDTGEDVSYLTPTKRRRTSDAAVGGGAGRG